MLEALKKGLQLILQPIFECDFRDRPYSYPTIGSTLYSGYLECTRLTMSLRI